MRQLAAILVCLALVGCAGWPAHRGKATIKTQAGESLMVNNPTNATQPAQIASEQTQTAGTIQPGSKLSMPVSLGGQPVTLNLELPKIDFTQLHTRNEATVSNERAPDRAVEMKAQADKSREPLLFAAIGLAVIGGVVAFVLKMPVIGGKIALLGGGGALAAWKFAEVPWWVFLIGLLLAAVGWAFYTRGKWDADGDGIPDFLEKKKDS